MLGGMKTTPQTRWPEGAIVYQIYPRSFFDSNGDGVGDIPGITMQLNHLKSLGVNAIWLSPFYPSPMADFGYDVADYCDVDPIFGKLADIDDLIKAAHDKNIRLIVDLVPNHTSDEHEWFHHSRQSPDSEYSDWYIWRDAVGHDSKGKPVPPNNWIEVLTGGPAWEWEPARQQFYLHSFDVRQPDLNWENPKVREAIKDAMRFWLDRGVDGFRVDAVQFIAKDPKLRNDPVNRNYVAGKDSRYGALEHVNNHGWPKMYEYLAEMATVLEEEKYQDSLRFMITEAYPELPNRVAEYMTYYERVNPQVAAPFNFESMSLPWESAAWSVFLHKFHRALDAHSPLCVASYAFGNHDQHRVVTRFGEPIARAAAVMLLSLPGMAFIYNGEEIGMKNGVIPTDMIQDPGARGNAGRDPERTPLQWTAGKNAGFSTANTTWLPIDDNYKTRNIASESENPTSFLSLYRKLGALRNSSAAIHHGKFEVIDLATPHVLLYTRSEHQEQYFVLINFSKTARMVKLPAKLLPATLVVSSDAKTGLSVVDDTAKLRPNEAAIFKV